MAPRGTVWWPALVSLLTSWAWISEFAWQLQIGHELSCRPWRWIRKHRCRDKWHQWRSSAADASIWPWSSQQEGVLRFEGIYLALSFLSLIITDKSQAVLSFSYSSTPLLAALFSSLFLSLPRSTLAGISNSSISTSENTLLLVVVRKQAPLYWE